MSIGRRMPTETDDVRPLRGVAARSVHPRRGSRHQPRASGRKPSSRSGATPSRCMKPAARRDPNDYTSRTRVGTSGRELGDILRWRAPAGGHRGLRRGARATRRNQEQRQGPSRHGADPGEFLLRAAARRIDPPRRKRRVDEALAILKETKDYPGGSRCARQRTLFRSAGTRRSSCGRWTLREAAQRLRTAPRRVMAASPTSTTTCAMPYSLSLLYREPCPPAPAERRVDKAEAMERTRTAFWSTGTGSCPTIPSS